MILVIDFFVPLLEKVTLIQPVMNCNESIHASKRQKIGIKEPQTRFTCPNCRGYFYQKDLFDSHLKTCNNMSTRKKSVNYNNNESLYKNKNISCQYCDESFSENELFLSHIKDKHNMNNEKRESFSCQFCNEKFPEREKLSKHVKEIHNMVRHDCYHCLSTFSKIEQLCKHMAKNHNMIEPTECRICKIWLPAINMTKHNANTHNIHEKQKDDIQHQCKTCVACFNSHTELSGKSFSDALF